MVYAHAEKTLARMNMPSLPRWTRPVAFLSAALAFAFLTTDRGLDVPSRLGDALFSFTLALALVGLVMIWRRFTRAHIPLGTLLVVVALFRLDPIGNGDRRVVEADLAAMRGMLQDPWSTSPASADTLWPVGSDALAVRAARKSLEDQMSWMQSLAGAYRVGPGKEPGEWLSAAYLADAGRYPEVGDYYARYWDYTRRVMKEFTPRMDSLARYHLGEAELSAKARQSYLQGARRALSAQGSTFEVVEQSCRHAVELHAFLVRVDPRVHLDPDGTTARFEDPVEQRQAEALVQALEANAVSLERVQTQGLQRAATLFDSLQHSLQPPSGPVPGGGT